VNIPYNSTVRTLTVNGEKMGSPIIFKVGGENISGLSTDADGSIQKDCKPPRTTSEVKFETDVPGLKLIFVSVFHSTIN
jgi:hypothetical protein